MRALKFATDLPNVSSAKARGAIKLLAFLSLAACCLFLLHPAVLGCSLPSLHARLVGVTSRARRVQVGVTGLARQRCNPTLLSEPCFVFMHSKSMRRKVSPTIREEEHVVSRLTFDAHKVSFP